MKSSTSIVLSFCSLLLVNALSAQQPNKGSAQGQANGRISAKDDSTINDIFDEKTPVKSDKGKAASSSSSASSSQTSSTTTINGKTVNITRTIDTNGKETVRVTTISRSGKPKVEEMTAEEFDAKYGKKTGSQPKAKPAPNNSESQPSTSSGKATE